LVNVVTMAGYDRLRFGMTIQQVTAILGAPGVERSSSANGNILESVSLVSWSNPDGSNLLLTFQGGVLVSKSQYGLTSDVTAAPEQGNQG
jgi:hypothetical protein